MEVNMEDKIISILNKVRTNLSNELETKTKELIQPFDDFANKLSDVEATPLKISGLSIEEIDNNFANISVEIIEKLEMYKKLSKLSFFPLTEDQKLDISNIMKELIEQINGIKKYIVDSNEILKDKNDRVKEIDVIIEKVTALYSNNGYLNSSDIMNIVNILKDSTLPVEEQIAIVQELSLLSLAIINSNEKEEQEEDILVIEETGVDREELVNLFKEYGYDFDDFKDRDKNMLLNYGRIENIRGILDVLASNNLRIYIKVLVINWHKYLLILIVLLYLRLLKTLKRISKKIKFNLIITFLMVYLQKESLVNIQILHQYLLMVKENIEEEMVEAMVLVEVMEILLLLVHLIIM